MEVFQSQWTAGCSLLLSRGDSGPLLASQGRLRVPFFFCLGVDLNPGVSHLGNQPLGLSVPCRQKWTLGRVTWLFCLDLHLFLMHLTSALQVVCFQPIKREPSKCRATKDDLNSSTDKPEVVDVFYTVAAVVFDASPFWRIHRFGETRHPCGMRKCGTLLVSQQEVERLCKPR